jgi:hypothetical protein
MTKEKRHKQGDVRESDGKIFYAYHKIVRKSGKIYEYAQWMTPEAFERNKQRIAEYYKNPKNKQKRKEASAASYQKNKEKVLARQKEYVKNNYDKIKKRISEYNKRPEVKERERKRVNAWRENNKKWVRDHKRKVYAENPQFAIACRLRCIIGDSMRRSKWRKKETTESLLGCTFEFLKEYLESKFKNGMSWDKPDSFHIDHIRPLASFDLTDSDQQKAACHWTNLQPLYPVENMQKGAKILTTTN